MNKDAILATVIGFAVGLIVTSIVLFGPAVAKSIKFPAFSFSMPSFFQIKKPTPSPAQNTANNPKDHFVTIDSPLNESLETTEKVLFSGSTSPKAVVIISSDTEDSVVDATEDGKYAGKITLVEGKNTITVTSITKEKKQTSQTVIVYFTAETL